MTKSRFEPENIIVKPEFQKHLENDNWKNSDYRKSNNILTDCHPAGYYKTLDNLIIEHWDGEPGSILYNYDKDLRSFINVIERKT